MIDSFHLYSATMQSNQSLVSANTWQEWSQRSLDRAGQEVGAFLGTKVLPLALSVPQTDRQC